MSLRTAIVISNNNCIAIAFCLAHLDELDKELKKLYSRSLNLLASKPVMGEAVVITLVRL